MTTLSNDDTVILGPGVAMPMIGFGTWRLRGDEAYSATLYALENGYRHIDTATIYGNEREVGRAIKDSGLRRELFVTTKMPPDRHGRDRETIEASLTALGLDAVDLWLIHWPEGPNPQISIWEQFLAARADGLARTVGVSNYDIGQIEALEAATGEKPVVNQVPWTPVKHAAEVLAAHRERGVVLEGYSGLRDANLRHKVFRAIAEAHGVTPAQVVLRWHLEHGIVIIPKSAHPERIDENRDLFGFALSAEEVAEIDALGR